MQKDKPSNYGVANWRESAKTDMPRISPRPLYVKNYFDRLYPASEIYSSILNPIFLFDLPALAKEKPNERWLIRDGLIPLLWFFRANPHPGNFREQLLIHMEFEQYVPDAWRKQTALYEYFPEKSRGERLLAKPKSVQNILLTGLIMPSVCSLFQLERELRMIKLKFKKMRLKAFLPARYEHFEIFDGTAFYNKFILKLCQEMGTEIEMLEHYQFLDLSELQNTIVHEFNEMWLYADSYFTRIALSKGAKTLKRPSSSEHDEIYPLFPCVSCGIRKHFTKPYVATLDDSVLTSAAHLASMWQEWFSSWCKDF